MRRQTSCWIWVLAAWGLGLSIPIAFLAGKSFRPTQSGFQSEFQKAGVAQYIENASDPGVTDDELNTSGNGWCYRWDRWHNTMDDTMWFCIDSSAGAAVWQKVGVFGGVAYHEVVVAANDSSGKIRDAADYVCDGVADNVQIQAALDLDQGPVRLVRGTYVLGAGITINRDDTHIIGAGEDATAINFDGTIVANGITNVGTTRYKGCRFEGFTLRNTNGAANGVGFNANYFTRGIWRDVNYHNCATAMVLGNNHVKSLIENCYVYISGAVAIGFDCDGSAICNDNTFLRCNVNIAESIAATGYKVDSADGNRFYDCNCEGSGETATGYSIEGTSANTLLSGCWIEGQDTCVSIAADVDGVTIIEPYLDGAVGVTNASSNPFFMIDLTLDDQFTFENMDMVLTNGGLIVPSGTTPAPESEGALFLDTDDGANGTLKMYSNSDWRDVESF